MGRLSIRSCLDLMRGAWHCFNMSERKEQVSIRLPSAMRARAKAIQRPGESEGAVLAEAVAVGVEALERQRGTVTFQPPGARRAITVPLSEAIALGYEPGEVDAEIKAFLGGGDPLRAPYTRTELPK